jgi:hypothetical protein
MAGMVFSPPASAGDESSPRSPEAAARLQKALADTGLGEHWVYDDIPAAMARATETDKPLMAVFR